MGLGKIWIVVFVVYNICKENKVLLYVICLVFIVGNWEKELKKLDIKVIIFLDYF